MGYYRVFVAALGGLRLFKSSYWTAHIVSLKKYQYV